MGELVSTFRPADGVAVVTMHRAAKKNALSIALRDALSDALDDLAADEGTRCVVLTGEGNVFSAGFDLTEFAESDPEHQRRLWASSDRFHQSVLRFPLPLIAAVNGPALAGGFDLAVMCDLRVVAASARFAHVEYAWTEVVYRPLRELVGGSLARELTLTGRDVEADEALRIGLANAVAPDAELIECSVEMARAVAAMPRQIALKAKAKIVAAAGINGDAKTLQL
jgi:enoyl-CoA hydratase/carnithine racemase